MRDLLRQNEGRLWAIGLVAAVVIVGVGLVVAPTTFWDHYLWRDIWGPTLADARHVPALCWEAGEVRDPRVVVSAEGVRYECGPEGTLAKSGYTIVSEITYGLILAALLYGIYRHVLQRHRVDTGGGFIVGLLPLILLGPFARVMEDADVFSRPSGETGVFAPLFISPWIYFQIAAYALAFLGIAILLDRTEASPARRRAFVVTVLAVETALYTFFTLAFPGEFLAIAPWWSFLAGAALSFALYVALVERETGPRRFHGTVAVLGLPLLAPTIYLMFAWIASPWSAHSRDLEPVAGLLMVVIAAFITYAVWWAARMIGATRPYALVFAGAVSVTLVFGHMIDGIATWIALKDPFDFDLGKYEEKHPVSDMLLQPFAGTPFAGLLFPITKLVMVLVVIHLLQKEFGNKPAGDPEATLGGLVKMAVFVLGFAPGVRDVLLVVMGF